MCSWTILSRVLASASRPSIRNPEERTRATWVLVFYQISTGHNISGSLQDSNEKDEKCTNIWQSIKTHVCKFMEYTIDDVILSWGLLDPWSWSRNQDPGSSILDPGSRYYPISIVYYVRSSCYISSYVIFYYHAWSYIDSILQFMRSIWDSDV